MTWPKIWYPIYDLKTVALNINWWRAFVARVEEGKAQMGEGGRDEEVASSKKIPKLCKNWYPIYDQNGGKMAKLIPYLWPKWLKNHTLWSRTYLYSPNKREPPPPGKNTWKNYEFFKCSSNIPSGLQCLKTIKNLWSIAFT